MGLLDIQISNGHNFLKGQLKKQDEDLSLEDCLSNLEVSIMAITLFQCDESDKLNANINAITQALT